MYSFPPSTLLQQVLSKMHVEKVPLVLVVALLHPRQAWFANMLELSLTHTTQTPSFPSDVHENPSILHLHAWMLSGDHYLGQAILRRLSPGWLTAVDPPLMQSTMASGK